LRLTSTTYSVCSGVLGTRGANERCPLGGVPCGCGVRANAMTGASTKQNAVVAIANGFNGIEPT
jgi:hypothetical protein